MERLVALEQAVCFIYLSLLSLAEVSSKLLMGI